MYKRIILLAVLLGFLPLFAKASTQNLVDPEQPQFLGFQDGNMYDPLTGTWKCMYLGDGNCYDLLENIITTRPVGYVPPVIVPETTPSQTVYVPVYSTPSNQIVGGVPVATGGVSAPVVQKVTFSNFNDDKGLVTYQPGPNQSFVLSLGGILKTETTGIATLTSSSLGYFETLTSPTARSTPWLSTDYLFRNLQPASDYVLTFTIDSPTASGTAVSGNLTIW